MATAAINGGPILNGSNPGAALLEIIGANDIDPENGPSYALCKKLYLFHPLGPKIASKPIELAQSEDREISVSGAGTAADKVRDEFIAKSKSIREDELVCYTMTLSRVYGAAAIACLQEGKANKSALDLKTVHKGAISFNVYDPLNIAGSLTLNLDPLSPNFLHVMNIAVGGDSFHRSRARVMLNEDPIYLAWTSSSYGYVGRSVYQRALLPMKSFVQTMITDDMVSRKAGVIVAFLKQTGTIVNQRIRTLFGFKRDIVKEAQVGNVISVGEDDKIESIDLKNLAEPFKQARTNIIENIASAVPMPAQMLTEETFGASFHEGSEDAKAQARYVRGVQKKMDPLYGWLDDIVKRLAWTPEFFHTIQAEFPEEFEDVEYEDFFWRCSNTFKAQWPSLLKEPDSELIKVDEIKLKSVIEWVEVLLPNLPQDQKAVVIQWANDKFNELKLLFGGVRLDLDYEAIAEWEDPTPPAAIGAEKDQFRGDSVEQFQSRLLTAIEKAKPRLERVK